VSKLRLAALTALVLAALPPAARAEWSPPIAVSAPGARTAAVAATRGGGFVVAWAAGRAVRARRLVDGRAGRMLTVSAGAARADDVALWPAPRGRTVVTWTSRGVIGLRAIGAGGRLGPRARITAHGSQVVAVPRADGSVTAAWIASDGSVRARRISPRGTAGAVTRLTAPGTRVRALVGAADIDGGALLVFDAGGMLLGQRILGDGSATRPSFPISPLGQTARLPQLATDGTGGATVLWVQDAAPASIQEVAVIADDKLSGLEQLSAPGAAARSPSLAFRNGSGVTVWEAQTGRGAVVAGLDSDGHRTTLSRPSTHPGLHPQAAIDAHGRGFAAWRRDGAIQVTRFGQRRVETLARGASPRLAASADGRAMAVWTGRGGRIRAARFAPPG
jgi:hypothetical protein